VCEYQHPLGGFLLVNEIRGQASSFWAQTQTEGCLHETQKRNRERVRREESWKTLCRTWQSRRLRARSHLIGVV